MAILPVTMLACTTDQTDWEPGNPLVRDLPVEEDALFNGCFAVTSEDCPATGEPLGDQCVRSVSQTEQEMFARFLDTDQTGLTFEDVKRTRPLTLLFDHFTHADGLPQYGTTQIFRGDVVDSLRKVKAPLFLPDDVPELRDQFSLRCSAERSGQNSGAFPFISQELDAPEYSPYRGDDHITFSYAFYMGEDGKFYVQGVFDGQDGNISYIPFDSETTDVTQTLQATETAATDLLETTEIVAQEGKQPDPRYESYMSIVLLK